MLNDSLRVELDQIRTNGLYRSLREVSSPQGREIILDGKKVLNFCSNDYLGLAADQRLAIAAQVSMTRSGFGSGASRLVCGNMTEHVRLEKEIAQHKKTEAALVFSSGYMANVGVITALCSREDIIFSDRLNHASILDGSVMSRAELQRYPHNDMAALEDMLARAPGSRRKLIVTDTVFSMDGDVAPLKELVRLAKTHGAWLMVDEAHAYGVFGPTGAGLVEAEGLGNDVLIQMGTLSKAAGSFGAYVAGSQELIDYLINSARSFIYSTAMPPAVAAASRVAVKIIHDEPGRRERLHRNADRLRGELQKLGFDTLKSASPIIPVVVGGSDRAVELSKQLLERGVFVSAIRPPTVPKGAARLRVTVTAAHTQEDIDRCLEAFASVRDRGGS
jgi:8-amino-7-oxononanoate synthase